MRKVTEQGWLSKSLKRAEKEARKRYGNEINIRKIYENLLGNILDALKLVFGYGEPGNFGDPKAVGREGGANGISSDEVSLLAVLIIQWYLDDKGTLLCIQDQQVSVDSERSEDMDEYFEDMDFVYPKILEKLHSLRNRFQSIREEEPGNYPDWIDEWEQCFRVGIENRYDRNIIAIDDIATRDKKKIVRSLNLYTCVGLIITCLILRFDRETGKIKIPAPNSNKIGKRFY